MVPKPGSNSAGLSCQRSCRWQLKTAPRVAREFLSSFETLGALRYQGPEFDACSKLSSNSARYSCRTRVAHPLVQLQAAPPHRPSYQSCVYSRSSDLLSDTSRKSRQTHPPPAEPRLQFRLIPFALDYAISLDLRILEWAFDGCIKCPSNCEQSRCRSRVASIGATQACFRTSLRGNSGCCDALEVVSVRILSGTPDVITVPRTFIRKFSLRK